MVCCSQTQPAVYSVQDLYPDVGVRLGIFRGKLVIALATALKALFEAGVRCPNYLGFFQVAVVEMGVREDRIVRIHDWVDTDLIRPLPRENAFPSSTA
jgi:colanic acid biosynthesis glycosyl transferase WcaI